MASPYREKQKVPCAKCHTPTNDIHLKRVAGIVKWVCGTCKAKMEGVNGV